MKETKMKFKKMQNRFTQMTYGMTYLMVVILNQVNY